MKNFILFSFSIFFIFHSQITKADFVDKTLAKTVAERYLILFGESSDINLELAHIEYFQNIAVYYVFNINSQGHIIIAADDRFDPIRAFIPNNIYSPESITFNPGFLWFSNRQKLFVQDSIINHQTNRKINKWNTYISTSKNSSNTTVGPFLNSGWGASSCFDDEIESVLGYACETGYPATATGQIMNYYKHPYKGAGSSANSNIYQLIGNAQSTTTTGVTLSVNHSNTIFDWNNIATDFCGSASTGLFSSCFPGDQTSEFLYHIGVALETEYCVGSMHLHPLNVTYQSYSFTGIDNIDNILEDHFGYDDDAIEDSRGAPFQTNWQWEQELLVPLNNSQPFIYQGSSCSSGAGLGGASNTHAWVCDGYTDNGTDLLFHMNWGMNCSSQDGWYSIRNNNPNTILCPDNDKIIKNIFPGTDLFTDMGATSYTSNNLTIRVRNDFGNGSEANPSYCNPYTIKFYASTNTTIDASDVYLTSVVDNYGMHGDWNSHKDFSVTIDPTAYGLSGNYYIGWIIDSENDVWERTETNNKGYYSSSVAFSCTDLELMNQQYNDCGLPSLCGYPPISINGTIINYTVEVENTANTLGSPSTPTSIGYYLSTDNNITQSDYFLGSGYIPPLNPGTPLTQNKSFDLSDIAYCNIPSGSYYIGVIIDYLDNIIECDETNNSGAFKRELFTGPIPIIIYYQFTIQRGCMSTFAYNYDPTANLAYCIDTCDYFIQGCTDPNATNYNPLATVDDGSCTYVSCGAITGVNMTDVIHDRVQFNWDNMNDSICQVDQIRIRYREVGTSGYTNKTMGAPVGSGCNTANTYKRVLGLSASTQYEYDFKLWYCGAPTINWHAAGTFTTAAACDNVTNVTAIPNSATQTAFCWTNPASHAFVRLQYRENVPGSSFSNIGGFGVMAPATCKTKNGLTPGTQYRVMYRTWCNPLGGPYRSPVWDGPVIWDQPSVIRLEGENTAITNLELYPNPSRNIFNITFTSNEKQDLEIRIINVIGETIFIESKQQFVGEYTKQINLEEYPKAIYFLEIETDDGVINKKLILQ